MYTVSVDETWHVAMDYGGLLHSLMVESTSRVLRHEVSTFHLCLPGLLLVSAGASGLNQEIVADMSIV